MIFNFNLLTSLTQFVVETLFGRLFCLMNALIQILKILDSS